MGESRSIPWEAVVSSQGALARYAELAAANASTPLVKRAADEAARLAEVQFDRPAIVKSLTDALAAFEAPPESLAAAASLADRETTLVITGQQPGFLGGPLFTLYKAAHAVVLARALASATGRRVVPAFWIHSDDHDLDETRGVSLADPKGELHRLAIDLGRGRPFLSDLAVPESAAELNERVKSLLPSGLDRERVLSLFLPRPGERFAAATWRVLLGLLGRQGLVVFEPDHLRPLLSRALGAVVRDARGGLERLAPVNSALRAAGLTPPFDDHDPAMLFERTPAGRERVHYRDGRFVLASGEELDPSSLASALDRHPSRFSAGVATRCAVEALALPVAATIRGPGELLYTPSAYAFLPSSARRRAPVEFPRFSATLVEPRAGSVLRQAGIPVSDFLLHGSQALDKVPPPAAHPAEGALDKLEHGIRETLSSLAEPLQQLDANLARPLEKTLATATSAVSALRARVRRSADEKSEIGLTRLHRAAVLLRPSGAPQERIFPAAPFLCQGLDDRLSRVLDAIPPFPAGHVWIELEPEPA
jgi:bacillithiol biosynthesis cysteine-adding enzyme BshC